MCYDDGEVGMHRLWQHDERIRVLSPVAHWPRDAALVRERLGSARQELHARKRQRREVGRWVQEIFPPVPLIPVPVCMQQWGLWFIPSGRWEGRRAGLEVGC